MNTDHYRTLIGGDYMIDYLILNKLSPNKILRLAKQGAYFAPMCADNYFWYLVADYHFPGVVPAVGTTWFQLVKSLISKRPKAKLTGDLDIIELFNFTETKGWGPRRYRYNRILYYIEM